jgi:hypothetical protein
MDLPFWALRLQYPKTVEAFCEDKPTAEVAPGQLRVEYTFGERFVRTSSSESFETRISTEIPEVKLTWYDGGLKPAILKEKGLPDWGAGVLFIGDEGMLLADYGRRMLFPEEKFADYQAPEPTIPNSVGHYREWINACKGLTPDMQPFRTYQGAIVLRPTTCSFLYSGLLAETVLLGAVAFRVGKKLEWNAINMKATNAPEADQYLSRPYRKGWEV